MRRDVLVTIFVELAFPLLMAGAAWAITTTKNVPITVTHLTTPAENHIVIDNSPPTNGSDTLEKVLVDIDGDGIPDAVWGWGVGHGGAGGMYWYTAPHSGDLTQTWTKHQIAAAGNFYEHALALSLVGDGIPDIVASDNDQLVWFKNPRHTGGDPTVGPWPMTVINSNAGCHDFRIMDIDGDGLPDIVCSGSTILGVSSFIAFQNSPTSWTIVSPANIGEAIGLLDIGSGKGAINFVGNDDPTGQLSWYENPRETGGNARIGAWIRHTIDAAGAEGYSMETGVLTTTGRTDLVIAPNEIGSGSAGVQWYQAPSDRRNGAWTKRTIDSSYAAVHHMTVRDMNGDGHNDIVVAEQEQAGGAPGIAAIHPGIPSRVTIFLNDGSGNFTPDVIATTGGQELFVADMGGGDLGILSSNHGFFGAANPLEMWVNTIHR